MSVNKPNAKMIVIGQVSVKKAMLQSIDERIQELQEQYKEAIQTELKKPSYNENDKSTSDMIETEIEFLQKEMEDIKKEINEDESKMKPIKGLEIEKEESSTHMITNTAKKIELNASLKAIKDFLAGDIKQDKDLSKTEKKAYKAEIKQLKDIEQARIAEEIKTEELKAIEKQEKEAVEEISRNMGIAD